MMKRRFQQFSVSLTTLVWFLVPHVWDGGAAQAQTYLHVDIGRVWHGQKWNWNNQHRNATYGFGDGNFKYHYPQDEWGAGQEGGTYRTFTIESILLYGATAPTVRNIFGHHFGETSVDPEPRRFRRIARYRQPLILFGLDEGDISGALVEEIDPLLPTDQLIDQEIVTRLGLTWSLNMWAMADRNNDRSIIQRWNVNYEGIVTEFGGANRNETQRLPAGQVLTFWQGHSFQGRNVRSAEIDRLQRGSEGNENRDDYYDYMTGPSRLLTSADAARAQQLMIVYRQDAKSPKILDWQGNPFDDTGDPLVGPRYAKVREYETGEFLSDQMLGSAILHFDMGDANTADRFHPTDLSLDAPASFFTEGTYYSVWFAWNDNPKGGRAWAWRQYTTPQRQKSLLREYYETNGFSESTIAGAPEVSETVAYDEGQEWPFMVSGPFQFNPGQDHDYVFTMSIADLPHKENIELGKRYLTWLAQQDPANHPRGINTGVAPLSEFEKHVVLRGVRDSLFQVVDNAFFAFHGGRNSGLSIADKKAGEGLRRMPDPPPPPDILVRPGPNRNDVYAWYPDVSMFKDVDTGVDDFAGWRVWRKKGRPDVNFPDEIARYGYLMWEPVATYTTTGVTDQTGQPVPFTVPLDADHYNGEVTFQSGQTRRALKFLDPYVDKGTDYFYAVSAFDDGTQNLTGVIPGEALEGTRFKNRSTGAAARSFDPGLALTDSVVIVPNPWSRDALSGLFPGIDQNKILFDKLPPLCTLMIFTETGDHVSTIEHTNLSSQEFWFQLTKSEQLVKSGIYILAVLNARDVDTSTGEVTKTLPDQFLKFLIIR